MATCEVLKNPAYVHIDMLYFSLKHISLGRKPERKPEKRTANNAINKDHQVASAAG